ncbi:MAG: ATP-binding protein [Planctomycetota bacterium]|nr:ATP-binding protein [Planctomycetota bacterium]
MQADRASSPAWPAIDEASSLLQADPQRAGELATEGLALAGEDAHGEARAAASFVLGRSHLRRGHSRRALHSLLDALSYYSGVDDVAATRVECCVGVAHGMWGNTGEATRYLEKAVARAERLDTDTLTTAKNSLAMALIKKGEYENARAQIEEVIGVARQHGMTRALSVALINLGAIHHDLGNPKNAFAPWEEALELKRELGDERGVASALLNIAQLHFTMGELDQVEATLRPGLELLEKHDLEDHLLQAHRLLANFEEARGNLPEALEALRRLTEQQERDFDKERTRKIAEMQARFNVEHAEREIERSRRRARELSDALRQADRLGAIGRLAGGVAHDFNNVLTAICGYAELSLAAVDEESPVATYAREILRSGERAGQLTQQLLAFSRKQVLKPVVLDLSHAVKDLVKMLQLLLGEDIELRTRLADDLHPVFVDAGQVEQIIVNLAVNARDAMPNGGVLRISTRNVARADLVDDLKSELDGDAFVRLEVADRGSGIPAHVLDFIFEPFFSTKDPADGTGLGLATVYGIVKQSNGTIRVNSTEGQGSSFVIFLPRTSVDHAASEPQPAERALSRGPETVLLVEDNASVRNLTVEILQVCGYRVLAAKDPDAGLAIAMADPSRIDLLLTDVVLPGMRGTELAERLRTKRPDLRVLYMSGYPFEALNDKGKLDPAIQLLQKPFSPTQLSSHVRAALDGAS